MTAGPGPATPPSSGTSIVQAAPASAPSRERRGGLREPQLVALGVAAAAPAALGVALAVRGGPSADLGVEVSTAAAGLALLGLAVGLNTLLRIEGLGGQGLTGAAGVLGATLLTLGGIAGALEASLIAGPDPGVALLLPLGRAGWLLIAGWVASSGWSLQRLLWPSSVLGWASAGAAAWLSAVGVGGLVHEPWTGARSGLEGLALIPLMLWSATVAGICAFGRIVRGEPPPE